MASETINVAQKLSQILDYWNPRIIVELNGQHVKLTKFKGEFVWHKDENEDELFYVISGKLDLHFKDRVVHLS